MGGVHGGEGEVPVGNEAIRTGLTERADGAKTRREGGEREEAIGNPGRSVQAASAKALRHMQVWLAQGTAGWMDRSLVRRRIAGDEVRETGGQGGG